MNMNKKTTTAIFFVSLVVLYHFVFEYNPTKESIDTNRYAERSINDKPNNSNIEHIKTIQNSQTTKQDEKMKQQLDFNQFKTNINELLIQIKNGEQHNISKKDTNKIVFKMQNHGYDYKKTYEAITKLYRSNITNKSKIFLVDLLGKIGTYDSTQTLMKILDINDDNLPIVAKNKTAIRNLVYKNNTKQINYDVSSVLVEYWKKSENKKYKQAVATTILHIGNKKESKHIIDKLDEQIDDDEVVYISTALKEINDEETTAYLYKKYNSEYSSDSMKNATIEALPFIANKTALLSLYNWSSKTSDIDKAIKYFEIAKKNNPKAGSIIKEELYANKIKFESDDVKLAIEKVFKK